MWRSPIDVADFDWSNPKKPTLAEDVASLQTSQSLAELSDEDIVNRCVLSLVNEEVLVPNSSDASLLSKLQQQHRASAVFKPMPRAHGEGFVITHFAGPVASLP